MIEVKAVRVLPEPVGEDTRTFCRLWIRGMAIGLRLGEVLELTVEPLRDEGVQQGR